MFSRTLAPGLAATLFLVTGCGNSDPASPPTDTPAFAQVPATGNGNKIVDSFDHPFPSVDCGGGEILDAHIKGWVQTRFFDQPNNRNVELDVFHSVLTFTNSAGETFTFHDLGPDLVYFDHGLLVVALMGRIGSEGVIGRLVINTDTGAVEFFAGKDIGDVNDLACQALT
jgi:hypothetical protein